MSADLRVGSWLDRDVNVKSCSAHPMLSSGCYPYRKVPWAGALRVAVSRGVQKFGSTDSRICWKSIKGT